MRQLVILDEAIDDLKAIARYVASQERDKARGAAFTTRLRNKCAELARTKATRGRLRLEFGHDLRSMPYLNYLLFFRYADDRVEIVAIIHSARDLASAFAGRKSPDDA